VTSMQTMNDFRTPATAFEGLLQNFDGLMYWMALSVMRRLNIVYGHSVLFRKADFYRVNAIEEIKDHIIDDRAMGIAFVDKGGMRIELSPRVTHTRYPLASWKKVAAHMQRWRHFYRVYSPVGTFAMVMYYISFWGLLTIVLSFFVPPWTTILGLPLRTLGFAFGSAGAGLRLACIFFATLIAGDKKKDLRYIWTILLSEPYAIYAHVACFFINSFEHAGRTYRVVGDKMKRVLD
jgi:hypothetical protein